MMIATWILPPCTSCLSSGEPLHPRSSQSDSSPCISPYHAQPRRRLPLFWMSRYIERAENNARILEVNQQLMLDFEHAVGGRPSASIGLPSSTRWRNTSFSTSSTPQADGGIGHRVRHFRIRRIPNSIYSSLSRARENARSVREQISSEMWEHHQRAVPFHPLGKGARELFHSSSYQFFKHILQGSVPVSSASRMPP